MSSNTDQKTATEESAATTTSTVETTDVAVTTTDKTASTTATTDDKAAPAGTGVETAAKTAAKTAAIAAPVLDPSKMTVDELVENFTTEQLRTYAETGRIDAQNTKAAKAAKPDEADASAALSADKTKDVEGEKTDDDADFVNDFKFTDKADAETLAKEESAYLEKVELPAPLQAMLDRRDAQIAELSAKAGESGDTATDANTLAVLDETAQKHMEAFNKLVSFKQAEDGRVIPDTDGVRSLLKEVYPVERRQLVRDLNSEPSEKYAGYTLLQELIRDDTNLDEQGMNALDQLLSNGGKMPMPSFVPEGINAAVAEAFWASADRAAIHDRLEAGYETLRDELSTEAEKAAAKADIQQINVTLAQIQRGLDADKSQNEARLSKQQSETQKIAEAGLQAYTETALSMLKNTTGEIAKHLSGVFDDAGANIVAAGFATMIENALSDQDAFAKAAQNNLAAQGITFNWKAGKDALEQLFTNHCQIEAMNVQGVNKRAIDLKREEQAKVLKELKGLEKELTGKIVEKVVKGSSKALAQKIAAAPKVSAVRPKASGTAGLSPKVNFDAFSAEELRNILLEARREMESHGIMLP